MDFKKSLISAKDENGQSSPTSPQTRLKCSFPIVIKGLNTKGEHYDEIALTEDIGRRGLCLRATQALIPGSIFTLYKAEDELDPVATFEVVWFKQDDGKVRRMGAQLVGDNQSWLKYLVSDVVILTGTTISRGRRATSH